MSQLALQQGDDVLALAHAQSALDIAIEVQARYWEAIARADDPRAAAILESAHAALQVVAVTIAAAAPELPQQHPRAPRDRGGMDGGSGGGCATRLNRASAHYERLPTTPSPGRPGHVNR
jgi:hypothetical protein